MRLIDADALKEVFQNEYKVSFAEAINEVIDGQLTIEPKPNWIPCSERLPEDSNFYIVTRKDFLVGFIWYSVFHGWEWDEQNNIIAWMPLPEPYQGESEQDE